MGTITDSMISVIKEQRTKFPNYNRLRLDLLKAQAQDGGTGGAVADGGDMELDSDDENEMAGFMWFVLSAQMAEARDRAGRARGRGVYG